MNPKTEKLLGSRNELYEEIFRVARLVLKITRNETHQFDDSDTIEMYGDTIEIGWEDYHCNCCGPDHDSIAFDLDYLFNDKWEEELRAKQAKEQAKKEAQQLKEKQEVAARKLANEHEKYLKLKEKFGEQS